MAKVDAFTIDGVSLWFYSNDHRPPHFHAKRAGQWEVRVFIETTTAGALDYDHVFEKKSGPNGRMRKTLREPIVAHREELLEEWEQEVGC